MPTQAKPEIATKRGTISMFEVGLALIVFVAFAFSIISQIELNNADLNAGNPFADYYSNTGIVAISWGQICSYFIFCLSFIFLCLKKYKMKRWVPTLYLLSALFIGFLHWFELYYGSTFYYGEVRDKQGLGFPFLSSFMVSLIIWRFKYSTKIDKDLHFKFILTAVINIGLFELYALVYEPWNLWQS